MVDINGRFRWPASSLTSLGFRIPFGWLEGVLVGRVAVSTRAVDESPHSIESMVSLPALQCSTWVVGKLASEAFLTSSGSEEEEEATGRRVVVVEVEA